MTTLKSCTEKSLKIPKGKSESVNQRRTTQWPKEKGQKDKRSTKHTQNNKMKLSTVVFSHKFINVWYLYNPRIITFVCHFNTSEGNRKEDLRVKWGKYVLFSFIFAWNGTILAALKGNNAYKNVQKHIFLESIHKRLVN